jgi:Uncharacterized conserved protein (DUF2183)
MGKGARTISEGDVAILFPTLVHRSSMPHHWLLRVSGAIYDPHDVKLRTRIMMRLLSRAMRIHPTQLESPIFKQRIEPFVGSARRGLTIQLNVGARSIKLKRKSRRNGLFAANVLLPDEEVSRLARQSRDRSHIPIQLLAGRLDPPVAQGCAYLVADQGVSVISDIDDTIKETHVSVRRELIENTFFREFRPISGMAEIYQKWARRGASFHYVSSSPWQLCQPLDELLANGRFPGGSFHLRQARLRDQVVRRLMLMRRKGKAKIIQSLLEWFPQRKFVLVGDSRERDPEMYVKLARKYPQQVIATFIRNYEDRPLEGERMEKIKRHIGSMTFSSFMSATELDQISRDVIGGND